MNPAPLPVSTTRGRSSPVPQGRPTYSFLNPRDYTKPPMRKVQAQAAIDNAEITNWQAKIDHARDHGLRFGRPRLRRAFGMRPRPGAKAVEHVRNPVRAKSRKMPLYRVTDCEIIQAGGSRKRTRAQKLHAVVQACQGKLKRKPERVVARLIDAHWAHRLVVIAMQPTLFIRDRSPSGYGLAEPS